MATSHRERGAGGELASLSDGLCFTVRGFAFEGNDSPEPMASALGVDLGDELALAPRSVDLVRQVGRRRVRMLQVVEEDC